MHVLDFNGKSGLSFEVSLMAGDVSNTISKEYLEIKKCFKFWIQSDMLWM